MTFQFFQFYIYILRLFIFWPTNWSKTHEKYIHSKTTAAFKRFNKYQWNNKLLLCFKIMHGGSWQLTDGSESETHILLKLCKVFPDAILLEDHSFTVRPALRCIVQALAHSQWEQRDGGGAMDIAGGQSGFVRGTVHMERPGTENNIQEKVNGSKTLHRLPFELYITHKLII